MTPEQATVKTHVLADQGAAANGGVPDPTREDDVAVDGDAHAAVRDLDFAVLAQVGRYGRDRCAVALRGYAGFDRSLRMGRGRCG